MKATIDALKIFDKIEDKGVCKIQFFKNTKIIAELKDKPTRIDLASEVQVDDEKKIDLSHTIPKLFINNNEVYFDKVVLEVDYEKE